jgi:Tfp pilus assembly protein PilF
VSLNEETIGYARKAIELLDGNKVTDADPFANLEAGRGFLNLALGWFLRTQSPVEAAAALVKAAKSDSSYKSDPLTYNLLGIAILKGEYAQVSADYNSKYGNKPPSPEQQAMLEHINQVGERAIDAYARAVALTTNPEQQEARNKMLSVLTALYKSFHNNSDAGLNDLIANVLTKPLP